MKSKAIAILALVSLCGAAFLGAAFAGINPANPGLPNVDTSLTGTDNNFYASLGTVPGQRGSVMCVACHTRNPAARTAYRSTKANWNYVGSHFVTRDFTDTAKGGGYTDGTTPKNVRRTTNTYIADNVGQQNAGQMTVTNGWYGLPEFGRLTGGVIDNNYTSVTTNAGQMICESCHNIVRNIGPAKLLATAFANGAATSGAGTDTKGTSTPVLCIGCHGRMDSNLNAEWQYHPIPTGTTWVGTQHHRNTVGSTGPANAYYFGATAPSATNMAAMARADYTPTVQMWAAGPGTLVDHNPIVYTGSRMKTVADNNQIMPTPVTNQQLLCTHCHRAHNADSSAGATILMRGDLAISAYTLIGNHAVPAAATTAYTGVYRMQDAGGRASTINSTNALCLACHQ
jgi:hypothetical protein